MKLALLLLFMPLLAAQDVYIDLSGDWKAHNGDDAVWASPGFDDSGWNTFTLPTPTLLFGRKFWLRRGFELPVDARSQPLVVTIGGFTPDYELFLNGVRIGEVMDSLTYPRARLFDVPPGLAVAGARNLIALHLKRPPAGAQAGQGGRQPMLNSGPFLVTSRANAPVLAPQLDFERRMRRITPSYGTFLVFSILSLLLLVFWLGEVRRVEFLALAMLLAYDALARCWEYFGLLFPLPPYLNNNPLRLVLALAFALPVLRFRIPPLWWLLAIPLYFGPPLLNMSVDWWGLVFWSLVAVECCIIATRWRQLQGGRALAMTAPALPLLAIFRMPTAYRPFMTGREIYGFFFRANDALEALLAMIMIVLLVRRLIYDRQEKRRYATELESARTVQQLLLSDPVAGTEAVYQPAQEVGGDFHWSRQNADGSILVAVGDVSGKGLKAAMLVSVTIGLLRAMDESDPAAILAKLNRGLLASTGGGFVTAAVALIDGDRIRIANAGHPAPYRDGAELLLEPGIPLGLDPSVDYTEQEFETGRQITFVSDGVIEAANAKGELFGFDRTVAISTQPAQAIADAAQAWGQNDDITVVTVRRTV